MNFPTTIDDRRRVLQAYHDHPLAGHPGIANTIHLLSQIYQGKDMKDFAESYVRGCAICQQNKPRTTHRKAPLQPITTDPHSGPFQMVAMDLITDLPESQGFDAVLTIVDHRCSKAAKFIPCNTTITGQEVCYAQALGVVDVGSLSVELSGRIRVCNSRPSCRASQGQNHGVRRGYRGSGEVRQSA